jgi:hypothetical protein
MKKKVLFLTTISALFYGCGKDESKDYMYQNNFENYVDWGCNNFNTIHRGDAHSGNWCVEIDSVRIYGPTFLCKMKDLAVKNPQSVKLSAWIYLPSGKSKTEVTVSIGESGKSAILWGTLKTDDLIDSEKKWVHVSGEYEIPDNVNPDANFAVTEKCTGTDRVLIDDIAFDLE